jgi:hypothetical protein
VLRQLYIEVRVPQLGQNMAVEGIWKPQFAHAFWPEMAGAAIGGLTGGAS